MRKANANSTMYGDLSIRMCYIDIDIYVCAV